MARSNNILDRQEIGRLIQQGNLKELFISHLNWENADDNPVYLKTKFAGVDYEVSAKIIAQKRGFAVCHAIHDQPLDKGIRQRLRRQLSKSYHEHLFVLSINDNNDGRKTHYWMAAVKRPNKPKLDVEVDIRPDQSPERLLQKLNGLVFNISEEGHITILDVAERVESAFKTNAEKVTRKFYERFRKELVKFQGFIVGLSARVDKEQFASLMLNRLMFIYFIQSKSFIDNNPRYLQDKLHDHLSEKPQRGGDVSFYRSFYYDFLRQLFHGGLGKPEAMRDEKTQERIGKVPFLNGGLFDVHQLEEQYKDNLDIQDKAFTKLFEFFDEYHWHLDTSSTASGKDINPDVIGYIFEKYINDRASMGAYYTAEDITGYIARNTILPRLLRLVRTQCREAFHSERGTIWRELRESPSKYIYEAVKHGGDISENDLPANIASGLDTKAPNLLERRKHWDEPADEKRGNPGETWRDALYRRERYRDLKDKIGNGKINKIADLITYNLDIEKLVDNVIQQHEGSDFISAFYAAIAGRPTQEGSNAREVPGITILDPACGSGAFLFAALNILEPLYLMCIQRMREFVAEDDKLCDMDTTRKPCHEFFRDIIREVEKHPSEEYFIYRNIILNNLFGVDIMPEAVEIAKLRLFLKLAAVAEADYTKDNLGLEPLPDIDYNIRTGNSLVGFASKQEFERIADQRLDVEGLVTKAKEQAELVGKAYHQFVSTQIVSNIDTPEFKESKQHLQTKFAALKKKLDSYLAYYYGYTDTTDVTAIEAWAQSHKPFHWFANFYGIMERGGFDVIIGNPPYIATKKVEYLKKKQKDNFQCPDIYGHMIKAALSIAHPESMIGFIVTLSLAVSENKGFQATREIIAERAETTWYSGYTRIPSGLFSASIGVRNTIFLSELGNKPGVMYTTKLQRWHSIERKDLFNLLAYSRLKNSYDYCIPLFDHTSEDTVYGSFVNKLPSMLRPRSEHFLYIKKTALYYISVSHKAPPNFEETSSSGKLFFSDKSMLDIYLLLFGGRLFFAYWLIFSDNYHVKKSIFSRFTYPVTRLSKLEESEILSIAKKYKNELDSAIQYKRYRGKNIGSFNTSKLWHITDKSDVIFLRHISKDPELTLERLRVHTARAIHKNQASKNA